ncbi:MAG: adenylosuccinate synthase, partial [Burkholderiaceae bacterium]
MRVSGNCPLILDYHIAVDKARELRKGEAKIGTTGRGIGPAYEDKVARRAVRAADLLDEKRLAERVREASDFHNFMLANYYGAETVDAQQVIDSTLERATRIKPMITDVSATLNALMARGERLLFEGAQGTLLDVDHGTYPFVTSSNTVSGSACAGAGVGPQALNYILGITKAYTTRVGSGPFPTELCDANGDHLRNRGQEFGSVTGRPRRCGWFDGAALRRAVQLNGLSGLALMKLDILDGLETVRLGVGYRYQGQITNILPYGADEVAACEPIYEDFPGWSESTYGAKRWDELPLNARQYLTRLAEVVGVPIALVSTGPDRDQTILLDHPFANA